MNKNIIYLHGFGSSGQSQTVSYLRKLMPDCVVIAPDIPVDPKTALPFLRSLCEAEKPDLVIGTSMGGMYAMQMLDYRRICVNPALHMSELTDILKVGTFDYFQPTASGKTSFTITEEIIQHFREMECHLYDGLTDESRRLCWGFFGDEDDTVDYKEEFQRQYYPNVIGFHGGHRMNNTVLREVIVPFAKMLINEERTDEWGVTYINYGKLSTDAVDATLKESDSRYAETANKISGRHLLIIDNPLEKDQSIDQACSIIRRSYAPESITIIFTS